MVRRLLLILSVLSLAAASVPFRAFAQPTLQDLEMMARIEEFSGEVENWLSSVSSADRKSVTKLERDLRIIKFRWETYVSVQMPSVKDVEQVSQSVASFEALCKTAEDSLASVKNLLSAASDFDAAEKALEKNFSKQYEDFTADALKYSMTKATASQLEKLKAQEQITFGRAQEQFQKAQAAAEVNPKLKKRMTALEKEFVDIQNASAQVQAAEYKPIVARIKDYLMSIAAVTLILMFFIMVQSKLKAIKAARENAKKYKEMLNSEEEYPTI